MAGIAVVGAVDGEVASVPGEDPLEIFGDVAEFSGPAAAARGVVGDVGVVDVGGGEALEPRHEVVRVLGLPGGRVGEGVGGGGQAEVHPHDRRLARDVAAEDGGTGIGNHARRQVLRRPERGGTEIGEFRTAIVEGVLGLEGGRGVVVGCDGSAVVGAVIGEIVTLLQIR